MKSGAYFGGGEEEWKKLRKKNSKFNKILRKHKINLNKTCNFNSTKFIVLNFLIKQYYWSLIRPKFLHFIISKESQTLLKVNEWGKGESVRGLSVAEASPKSNRRGRKERGGSFGVETIGSPYPELSKSITDESETMMVLVDNNHD